MDGARAFYEETHSQGDAHTEVNLGEMSLMGRTAEEEEEAEEEDEC